MAVAFGSINASTLVQQSSAVVTCPSGTTTGDLLLLFAMNDQPSLYTTPTGFTLITAPGSTSTDVGSGCWYKIATSGDVAGTTTYTVTESTTSTLYCNAAVCARYTGVNSSSFPLAAARYGLTHSTTTTNGGSACPAPTNPSTIGASDMVVRIWMAGDDATTNGQTISGSPPTGWTQRGSYRSAVTSTYNLAVVVCDRLGATDTSTITSTNACMWDIYTLSLPAAAAAAGPIVPSLNISQAVKRAAYF